MDFQARLLAHAASSTAVRNAAVWAADLSEKLTRLNGGFVFDLERDATIRDIQNTWSALAHIMELFGADETGEKDERA